MPRFRAHSRGIWLCNAVKWIPHKAFLYWTLWPSIRCFWCGFSMGEKKCRKCVQGIFLPQPNEIKLKHRSLKKVAGSRDIWNITRLQRWKNDQDVLFYWTVMIWLINHNRFQHQYHFNHSGSVARYMLGQAAGCASFSEKAKIGKGNCFIFESESISRVQPV